MSDGWESPYEGCTQGKIGNHWFSIWKSPDGFKLHMPQPVVITRDTMEECQALAEATARLWAGESE